MARAMLYPHRRYRGEPWTPQAAAFHNNLEEFAEQVGLIVGLQSNGKLSQDQAYARIKGLWDQLQASHESLLNPPNSPTS